MRVEQRKRRARRGLRFSIGIAVLAGTVALSAGPAGATETDDSRLIMTLLGFQSDEVIEEIMGEAPEIGSGVMTGTEIPDESRDEIMDDFVAEMHAIDDAADRRLDEVLDSAAGMETMELRRFLARREGCAEHAIEDDFGSDTRQTSYIRVEGTQAVVSFHLAQKLCQPITVELLAFSKDFGLAFPYPQTFHDAHTVTVQEAGGYELRVDLPTTNDYATVGQLTEFAGMPGAEESLPHLAASASDGNSASAAGGAQVAGIQTTTAAGETVVCAAQIDLTRNGGIGLLGVVVPGLLDAVQLDVADGVEACTEVASSVVEASVTDTAVAGVQTIPRTGSETPVLFTVGVGLVAAGWFVLTVNAAVGLRRRTFARTDAKR